MAQTIDLRKKEEPFVPPQPPVLETAAEETPDSEQPAVLTSSGWFTHLAPPPNQKRVWYMIAALIVAAVIITVAFQDIMFTMVLALAALVLTLHAFKPHQPSHIHIHATGVSIDDTHHRFADIKSFWIAYNPPHLKELSLEFKKGLTHRLHIPIENQNPLEIRQTLISYVPEKEHEPSMIDHLVRLIGI